jgi:hypothetical protein
VSEGKGDYIGELFFDWKDGYTFPANHSVAVSITNLSSDGCAGIDTRDQKAAWELMDSTFAMMASRASYAQRHFWQAHHDRRN